MIIVNPITNKSINDIQNYLETSQLEIDTLKIFMDLQNISVGKYYPDNLLNYFNSVNEKDMARIVQQEIILLVHNKIKSFLDIGIKNIFVYLYTDENKNIVNEYFISSWKTDRGKVWESLHKHYKDQYDASSWFSTIYDASIKSLSYLCNTSRKCKIISLRYIDSDFVPNVFIELDKQANIYNHTLYLIVTNDHDYLHLTNYDHAIIYVPTEKEHKLLNKYNVYKRFEKKFPQKTLTVYDRQLIAKFYPIFHSLIGDPTDSIKPVIAKKGIIYWFKQLKDILVDYDDYTSLRYDIITDKINLVPDNIQQEFINRLYITDFYFFSLWLIYEITNITNSNIKVDQAIIDKTYNSLPVNIKQIFKDNALYFLHSILTKDVLSQTDASKILANVIQLYKDANEIVQNIW